MSVVCTGNLGEIDARVGQDLSACCSEIWSAICRARFKSKWAAAPATITKIGVAFLGILQVLGRGRGLPHGIFRSRRIQRVAMRSAT